jgi:uncharacterized protein
MKRSRATKNTGRPSRPRRKTGLKPSPADFSLRTKNRRVELLALAKSFGIKGLHRMTKPQLIEAIGAHMKKSRVPKSGRSRPEPARSVARSTGAAPKKTYEDLPWSYGETELVLMPVDPFQIFAAWDFSRKDWEAVCERKRPVVLRVYDITMIRFNGSNAHSHFDVPVVLESQSWYIPIWSAEKSLCAELGWLDPDGRFRRIVRSNVIATPRAGVSTDESERWIEVRWSRRRPTRRIPKRRPVARPDLRGRLQDRAGVLSGGESGGFSSRSIRARTPSRTRS